MAKITSSLFIRTAAGQSQLEKSLAAMSAGAEVELVTILALECRVLLLSLLHHLRQWFRFAGAEVHIAGIDSCNSLIAYT